MKAAILHGFKKTLEIEDVPRPVPEANELLIRVEACGVCHSDLHIADGDWPQFTRITKMPLILGHEIAGRVVEKGSNVREFQIGDRVGVSWIHWTCGESLHRTKDYGSDRGRRLRRVCESPCEPRCEDPR